ncbi:MAG TPA: PepSY domain-containing protein [Methanobacteriaceae archaeon]|nr:PepSY domain-containing protein [Methanobacteriaceae archaeon]HNS24483.1 PepSY domain-containing protein [Methanobacteriaceae archaeon]
MIKKAMIGLIILTILVVAVSGCLDTGNKNNTTNNNSNLNQNTTSHTNITATQAQELAKKYIEQEGASAGTPQLTSINGKPVYIVPIIYKGKAVGQIEIDATTGQNIGGAGGAP